MAHGRRPLMLCLSLTGLLFGSGCQKRDVPEIPEEILGHCTYTNRFSRGPECRDYHGNWTEEQLREDCDGWGGEAVIGAPCNIEQVLGYCVLETEGRYIRVSLPGNDAGACGSSLRGCELFGGGAFDAAPICGGEPDPGLGGGLPVFQQPVRSCVEPRPGEPPGRSAGGQVCTWEAVSGATEEGRRFSDYASCDRVRTQRPYYPAPPAPDAARADARLADPAYVAELRWVETQIRSSACVCCHSTSAPLGPANWFLESPGNFVNSFKPRGLAMGAGWIDTVGFGAFPPEENNGFTRATPDDPTHSIFLTTDAARMKRFFEAELQHRGLRREDFAAERYGGGPVDAQRFFRPTACTRGEGVGADGRVIWKGGGARYVYVLEAEADTPTVPPNLDLPRGTLWRIDVPSDGRPLVSGTVRYGQTPPGTTQRYPATGAPAALQPGRTYYLYVTADVIQPITRCLFSAP